MREYELLFIIHPDCEGDRLKEVVDKFSGVVEQNGGEVLKVDEWGRQKLAYQIKKCSKGTYVLLTYLGPPTLISELERILRLDELVLKYLTVKLSDKVDPEKRRQEVAAEKAKLEAQKPRPVAEGTERKAPEPEKPRSEKPEPEKPRSEKPEPEKPGSEKPEPEKPGSEKPEPENSAPPPEAAS